MPKKEMHKKFKGKILEKSEDKINEIQRRDPNENDLAEQIKKFAAGLYYISETDAEILPFAGTEAKSVTVEEVLSQTKSAAGSPTEERDFSEFFARFTEMQDWFGDEEKETAQKFVRLKQFLEKNLKDLKVIKIGKIQLDVYVVGLDAESRLMGIKTKAVET